jgi:3-oxoacyl-[acyl-carrier protein] reductase
MSESLPLAGQVALVTGAAKRLGRHLALQLAKDGADLILHYRSSAKGADVVAAEIQAMGRRARLIQADFEQPDGADSLVRELCERGEPLNVLINNVGNYPVAPLHESNAAQWRRTLDVNLVAPKVLMSGLRDLFPSSGGAIVNIGDAGVESLRANTETTAYQVSKAGLLILTKSFALDFAKRGIRVNMISPGQLEISVDLPEDLASAIPLGRAGTLEDVAVVLRMLVEPGSYVTGVNIDVAGGYRL